VAHDIDRLREEQALALEVAELENELVELKADKANPRYRECKLELRELRRFWRDVRDALGDPEDGTVRPATIAASAAVSEV
jgi:hypothetical protein